MHYHYILCILSLFYCQESRTFFRWDINFFNVTFSVVDDGEKKVAFLYGFSFSAEAFLNFLKIVARGINLQQRAQTIEEGYEKDSALRNCMIHLLYHNKSGAQLMDSIFVSLSLRHKTSKIYKPTQNLTLFKSSLWTNEACIQEHRHLKIMRTLAIRSSLSGNNINISYTPDAAERIVLTRISSNQSQNNGKRETIFKNPSLYVPYLFNYYANLGFSISKDRSGWDMSFHNADYAKIIFGKNISDIRIKGYEISDKELQHYLDTNLHKFSALLLSFVGNAAVYGWQEAGREIAQEAKRHTTPKSDDASFGALVKYLEMRKCTNIPHNGI